MAVCAAYIRRTNELWADAIRTSMFTGTPRHPRREILYDNPNLNLCSYYPVEFVCGLGDRLGLNIVSLWIWRRPGWAIYAGAGSMIYPLRYFDSLGASRPPPYHQSVVNNREEESKGTDPRIYSEPISCQTNFARCSCRKIVRHWWVHWLTWGKKARADYNCETAICEIHRTADS